METEKEKRLSPHAKKERIPRQALSNLYILKGADGVRALTSTRKRYDNAKVNVNTPITITGRHVEVTDAIREFVTKKLRGSAWISRALWRLKYCLMCNATARFPR